MLRRRDSLLLRKVTYMIDFLVLYSSTTGNTKAVATAIFNALPGISKELCDIRDFHYDKEAKLYFVGFRTNRRSCDISILNLLSSLHEKKIALFGTCGMGNNAIYYHTLANNVSAFIPEDCEYLGSYLCQGRMPLEILHKYENLQKENPAEAESISMLIQNFNEASSHPDEADLSRAQDFVTKILGACMPDTRQTVKEPSQESQTRFPAI